MVLLTANILNLLYNSEDSDDILKLVSWHSPNLTLKTVFRTLYSTVHLSQKSRWQERQEEQEVSQWRWSVQIFGNRQQEQEGSGAVFTRIVAIIKKIKFCKLLSFCNTFMLEIILQILFIQIMVKRIKNVSLGNNNFEYC